MPSVGPPFFRAELHLTQRISAKRKDYILPSAPVIGSPDRFATSYCVDPERVALLARIVPWPGNVRLYPLILRKPLIWRKKSIWDWEQPHPIARVGNAGGARYFNPVMRRDRVGSDGY